MLRDISESEHINANVLEQLFQKGKLDKSQITLKCIILSEQFWAKTKRWKRLITKWNKTNSRNIYKALKGNRTLVSSQKLKK